VSADHILGAGRDLVMRERTHTASGWSATATLAWRAMLKIKHVPFQLFDVTFTPVLFTLVFTYMFGGALAGSPEVYLQSLLPGILVQTILFITVYTGVGLNTDIQKGLFDRFRSLPIWQPAPILGALVGDVFRYSIAGILILVLGVILGFRPAGGLLGVLLGFALVLVFAFAMSWIWIIFGLKVKTPESVMTTSFVFLMPLTFASNIFVEPGTMPPWLQTLVRLNPVSHLTSACRGLMHGAPVAADILWVLVAAAAMVLVAAPIALHLYHRER
jgi:ABC-2 type transport system permease protein